MSELPETFGGMLASKAADNITDAITNLGTQLGVQAAFALPVGCQNSATASDQRFQAAAS